MAPPSLLRRVVFPTACAILVVFVLLGTHPSYTPFSASSTQSELSWTAVWRNSNPLRGGHGIKTSQLHYLIPASHTNLQLCQNLVSSAVNRYPVPTILGWNATGEFNAAVTHLAKLRATKRYLDSLKSQEDDDLVLIVDAYDIVHQLPAEVVIERYFDVADRADAHLAERFNISVADARKRNLRQTVFWGPDKICFPLDPRAPRCWAVPPSPMGPNAFGPRSGNGDLTFNEPRWLNSGTVIGPIGDVRALIDATMDEIKATYDESFNLRDSDQYYVSNVWARQEYWRSKEAANGGQVDGGPADRIVPEDRKKGEQTELHVAIEYESALFQTKAGYEPFLTRLSFDQSNFSTIVKTDVLEAGDKFQPYSIEMPPNVHSALTRLYDAIPDAHRGTPASDWIRTVSLGVNLVTKHIYALWHCTGPKDGFDAEYRVYWWYPFAESLLKSAVKSSQAGELISPRLIDGRRWVAKGVYPLNKQLAAGAYGGAWSDDKNGTFITWPELCGPHEESLFQGERNRAVIPGPLSRRAGTQRQP